ncbi:lipid kinase [Pleomorphomonas diazotrophica]|uniref:Lipid kinase n=1 Tax=Pleomorphomonas diazotrophica TaxID=1166257 RepID=A0A1I4U8M7_9HYPH|nr:lipid kinase [Pleomorphomonas diazotrophica]PKR91240.1 lipid kinase [Pleomorphomonas diazotrophica]SFM85265.1 lipid kinase, YegS/Rv2252/BmrU family [Pleomorphomonas diazotrophica]
MDRRALILANPHSRSAGAGVDAAAAELHRSGIDVLRPAWREGEPLAAAIARHGDKADFVVIAGGDGSLNAAAPALIESGLPLGILPGGTANDLARTLGLPLDMTAAAKVIAAGRTKAIDVGEVNGKPFFNVASLGMSASLADRLSRETKRRWGRLAYALTATEVLIEARRFGATIRSDDGEEITVRSLQIAVGNGRHYGGGMIVEETAEIDDGRLDLYSLEFRDVWKLPFMALAFRKGRHGLRDEVRTMSGTRFEIRTRRARPVNADGEIVTQTPAVFSVRPGAVRVFVP